MPRRGKLTRLSTPIKILHLLFTIPPNCPPNRWHDANMCSANIRPIQMRNSINAVAKYPTGFRRFPKKRIRNYSSTSAINPIPPKEIPSFGQASPCRHTRRRTIFDATLSIFTEISPTGLPPYKTPPSKRLKTQVRADLERKHLLRMGSCRP